VFNYIELREELEKKGHAFYTHTDTEVIVHLYEEYGLKCFDRMNGQFAIALWDEKKRELILARDRVGIRPLFYSGLSDGSIVFASEIKSIFRYPGKRPAIDPSGLNQIFTLWVNVPPRTVFKGINELPPGCFMTVNDRGCSISQYWKMSFPHVDDLEIKPIEFYTSKLEELVYDAVTIRLRADVPVAAYLSGGLDSSIISSIVKRHHDNDLVTFSVTFSDPAFDETAFQNIMVSELGTDHRSITAGYSSIGEAFSDVVWYSEKPMIRTAPAPLYLLSGLVRSNNIKVVLTGEGADEIFGGYNIFKEDKIRRFWARDPDSTKRPGLLSVLYPYIARDPRTARFWQSFFKKGLHDIDNPFYSHSIRWHNTAQIKSFFHEDLRRQFSNDAVIEEVKSYIDKDILKWHPLCRAQYLETVLFMSGYLLSSQGDRMMLGNSVEGRFPFLDYRVIDFASSIPPVYKIFGLNEKFILKKAFEKILPKSVVHRPKQPYRAPISQCFLKGDNSASAMLSDENIKKCGLFDSANVGRFITKLRNQNQPPAERDDMSLVGIVSTQILHAQYVEGLGKGAA
jgi:asparagine synthase (glutamine-hydrolysing)